jgi:type III secretion system YscD/HrpQ family protein
MQNVAYKDLQKYIKDNKLYDIQVNNLGIVTVEGYIDNYKRYDDLVTWINANQYLVKLQVQVLEKIKNAVETVVEANGLSENITISSGDAPGVVVAEGYLIDHRVWEDIKKQIQRDISEVTKLVDNVDYQTRRYNLLTKTVKENGLEKQVHLKNTDKGIVALLTLDPQRSKLWDKIYDKFNLKYGNETEILFRSPSVNGFDIKGVSLGLTPYIIMSDNKKYQEQDRIPNGYKIEDIGSDSILFEKDGHFLSYPIGL